jgi:acyl-CoA thioesterase-1
MPLFRRPLSPPGAGRAPLRSYGSCGWWVQTLASWAVLAGLSAVATFSAAAPATGPLRIVALGDSLTAGYGLPVEASFPVKLERALAEKGVAAEIVNAGVSGDTASDGLARLDWSIPEGTEAVILELGANDMLRGIDPKVTRTALQSIVHRLKTRNIAVLLCGMRATPNLGADYAAAFDSIFPDLATDEHVLFYPFFLDGVAADGKLNQRDGLHPNAAGIDTIVAGILPKVEELATQAFAARRP